jgi:hypothetical protein
MYALVCCKLYIAISIFIVFVNLYMRLYVISDCVYINLYVNYNCM